MGARVPTLMPLLVMACFPSARTLPASSPEEVPPTVILVSLDGFRWDYMEANETPTLDRLAVEGVRAAALVPSFPSKTFPNHYSIATGLYPEHHGIVENSFYDPERDDWFSLVDHEDNTDPTWFLGEPIWITAEKQGQPTATMFWVGSEVPFDGILPTTMVPYNGSVPFDSRVDTVLSWLDEPADARPRLITLYMSEPDGAGHAHGPESAEVSAAVGSVDGSVGRLVEGLETRGLLDAVDLIVLSDHGMADLSDDRVIFLDDSIDSWALSISNWGSVTQIWAEEEEIAGLLEQLSGVAHLACARKEELPAHLHFSESPRIAPLVCVADPGWTTTSRSWYESYGLGYAATHGWDPEAPDMQGLFVARGPHLVEGEVVQPFENVEIYGLMCEILGLEPASNDGDLTRVAGLLRGS